MSSDEAYSSELEKFLSQAQHPKVVELLQSALDKCKKDATRSSAQSSTVQAVKAKPKSDKPSVYFAPINSYGWDQSSKYVKIYVSSISSVDELKEENVKANFTEKSFELQVLNVKDKCYSLEINSLLKPIVPDKSTVKVKGNSVVLSLFKKSQDNWSHLTVHEKKMKDSKDSAPKYDSGKDPGEGIMDMMKKMYNEGDDEMKRTIAKAWTESQERKTKDLDGF
ncbi:calcyclin-binding protein-like [Dysidea avara]|uniref:calcyclin-binding protein-like n=1 Tax=Dysidea avara TaxID=196820 RepID=UPI003319A076